MYKINPLSNDMSSPKIGAIIVLFKPDLNVTLPALKALAPQVNEICVVDNTPGSSILELLSNIPNLQYIPLGENRGIAAAQNIGIEYFINSKYKFIIFSDQDSIAPKDIVHNLLADYNLLKKNNYPIGLIGPIPINKQTGKPYTNQKNIISQVYLNNRLFIEAQSIISSFSLVPIEYFIEVGKFYPELFIDFVEIEWCFRLKNKLGLSAYISSRLKIQHELGLSKKNLGMSISISSPFRLYYQIRNFLWLTKLPYIPKSWQRRIRKKFLLKFLYYPLIPSNRMEYIKSIWRGVRDGINKKLELLSN